MAHKPFGKIIFIVLLACLLGYAFYSDDVEGYRQSGDLTLDKYIADFDDYKERESRKPIPLWGIIVAFLLVFAALFGCYELMGFLFAKLFFRGQGDIPASKRYDRRLNRETGAHIGRKLKDTVRHELEPGEKIEWMAPPAPQFFSSASTPVFLFSIPWTAFALFWIIGASQSSEGLSLFGVPFILIGIWMMSSPLWVYYKTLQSVYVITDKRAITVEGGRSLSIRSYPPEMLQSVYRRERKNGTGDVIFAFQSWKDSDGDTQRKDLGFINIREPRKVEKMLKKMIARLKEKTRAKT